MSSPSEQIKQRLGIAEVIQSYIKLDKAGANFRARCPFHSEKTPSFFVSPSRDIWHCFGCGKGGDIFGFVMEMEGVEFIEALKILAERAGIKLKMEDPRLHSERMRLLNLMSDAADFYRREILKRPEVSEYLRARGLKNETIQSYHLGYAPREDEGWRNLYEFLLAKGYLDEEMEKAGMVVKSQNSNLKSQISYYDRFRGRIMFPIFDFSGRVVAFSGRIFPETDREGVGKYINSPQTVLYDKSRVLYGFDKAKTEIRKKDSCVVVEGQMDVLMSHQAEVLNAVAVSGTGLAPYHLESISRLTNNLIVCFDEDDAGNAASDRGFDLALAQIDNPASWQLAMLAVGKGFEVKVVILPFGKDPADVASKDQVAWQKAVEESRHIIDFYLHNFSAKISDPRILKIKVEQIVLPHIILIQSEIEKSHWVSEIAKRLSMREEPIWEQLKKIKLKQIKTEDAFHTQPRTKNRRLLLEERILGIAFWKNDDNIIPKDKYFLFSEKNRLLLENIFAGKKLKGEEKQHWERLALEGELVYGGAEDRVIKKEAGSLMNSLECEAVKMELSELAEEVRVLEMKGDENAINEKLSRFQELTKKYNQIRRMAEQENEA